MYFLETSWRNFRNLEPRRQTWRPGLNVFLGPNGSGKTNILESINVLSGWGQFPSAGGRISSMIAWESQEKNEKTVSLHAMASGERDLEVTAQVGERLSLRASNERVTYSELRSLVPSLSFLPGDVNLLDGSPSVRRLFMDKLCALCSPAYARRLAEYRQLVRQRTALLRRRDGNVTLLRASGAPLAKLGGWIRYVRLRAVRLLGEILNNNNNGALPHAPSKGLGPFEIPFIVELGMGMRGGRDLGGLAELEDYVVELGESLESGVGRELAAGLVLSGPHRDDLSFSCLGRPAALSLSRGQKRRVVIAAILATGRLIETTLRLKPILILDDIAAELDADGKALLGQALLETGWQVFTAAAETENPFKTTNSTIWRVKGGQITQ